MLDRVSLRSGFRPKALTNLGIPGHHVASGSLLLLAPVKTTLNCREYGDLHVRTLCHYHRSGSDAVAVSVSGSAKFPPALQCCADPADPRRPSAGGAASLFPGEVGSAPVLG